MSSQIQNITLIGVPGLTTVAHADLAFVTVIAVWREPNIHFKVNPVSPDLPTPAPGDRQYYHDASGGSINFGTDYPFAGPTFGRPDATMLEKIFVIYKR